MRNETYLVRQAPTPQGYKRRQSGLYVRDQPMVRWADSPSSGQAHIPRDWALDIAGQRISAAGVYLGHQANENGAAGPWPERSGAAGGSLTKAFGSPTYDRSGIMGVGGGEDKMVSTGGAVRWEGASNTWLDVTTQDLVVEFFGRINGSGVLFAKEDGSTRWTGYVDGTYNMGMYLQVGGGTTDTVKSGVLSIGQFIHLMGFFDHDGYGRWCINGAGGASAVSLSHVAGSWTAAAPFCVGSYDSGVPYCDCDIVALAVWMQDSALTVGASGGHEDVAAERFQRWCGVYPQLAPRGGYPITFTRSTTKYYHRTTGSATRPNEAHLAGAGMLAVDDDGVPIHTAHVSRIGYSIIGGTGWTADGSCTVTGSQTAPDGSATANKITACGATGGESLHRSVAGFTADTTLGVGFWFKRSSTSGTLSVWSADGGAAKGDWDIDLSALDDEWQIIDASHPAVTVNVAFVSDGSGDAGLEFQVDSGTLDFYAWESTQTESAGHVPVPGPPVPVHDGSATATCNADQALLNAALAAEWERTGEGTIELKYKYESKPSANSFLFCLADATGANRIVSYMQSNGYLRAQAIGGTAGDVYYLTNTADGDEHSACVSWKHGRFVLLVDGAVRMVDVSMSIPSGFVQFLLGCYVGGVSQLGGHIYDVRGWAQARH